MSMFFYYVSHTFINSIKKLFKSWVVIVFVVALVFGFTVGIGSAVIAENVEQNTAQEQTVEENAESVAETEDEERITPQEMVDFVYPIIEMAVFGGFFVIVFINLYTSDKKGNSIFNMADVNFLFSSPLSPQRVLFFKTIMQALLITVLAAFYLSFQMPNLTLNLGLSTAAAISVIVAFIIAMLFGRTVSVLSYSVAASKVGGKKFILPVCIGILAAAVVIFFATQSFTGFGYFDTAKLLFASRYSRFFPLFGWLAGATLGVISGNYLSAAVYYGALAVGFAILLFIVSRIKADFYEDALVGAQKNQEKLEAAGTGRQQSVKKHKKEVKETEIGKGYGATVFFTKEMYLRRRSGITGILTKTGTTYLLLAIALGAFMKFIVRASSFAVFGFAILAFAFFRNFATPISADLQALWLRLVPESKYKKIFFSMLGGTVGAVIDAVPAFVVSAVLLEADVEALVWFVIFATFDFFISSCALAAEAIIPDTLHPSIKTMFCIYFRMFIVIPAVILLAIGLASQSFVPFALLTVMLNLLLGTGFFFLGAACTRA